MINCKILFNIVNSSLKRYQKYFLDKFLSQCNSTFNMEAQTAIQCSLHFIFNLGLRL